MISITITLGTDGIKRYVILGFMCNQRKENMCLHVCMIGVDIYIHAKKKPTKYNWCVWGQY